MSSPIFISTKNEKKRLRSELIDDPTVRVDQSPKRRKLSDATKISLSDFTLLKKIGKGAFGDVYLCLKEDTKEILALKIMKKSLIWQKNKLRTIKTERDVLARHLTNYMVKLVYSFQDIENLYLAMEYCPGGDLRRLLDDLQTLTEDEARIYLADMIVAVDSLHQLGYIHRDLKPDNFLIDSEGHLKLADFGLSKEGVVHQHQGLVNTKVDPNPESRVAKLEKEFDSPIKKLSKRQKAHSIVGSPDYMSPEVLCSFDNNAQGYGKEVDWWSIGCIFVEMLAGFTPFAADSPDAVFDNIKNHTEFLPMIMKEYIIPNFSADAADLIQKFLSPAEARIGNDGIDILKQHPFFKAIDWSNLLLTKPLFVPKLESDSDTIYFDGVPQDDKENNTPNSDRLYSPAASRRKSKFSQQKSFSMQANKMELQKSNEKINIIENDFSDGDISEQVQALDVTKGNTSDELYDKRNILGFSFKKSQLEQFMTNRKSAMAENDYM